MLAVQNMSACDAVSKSHEVEFSALEGSLNMMSKVLNDVLDLWVNPNETFPPGLLIGCYSHRLDSGKFESLNKVRSLPSVAALRPRPLSPPALHLPSSHGIAFHTSPA